jgi:hypothetical protein
MTGIVHEGSFSLPDALKDPQFGPSNESSKSAFMYFHKELGDGSLFSYLHTKVSPAINILDNHLLTIFLQPDLEKVVHYPTH